MGSIPAQDKFLCDEHDHSVFECNFSILCMYLDMYKLHLYQQSGYWPHWDKAWVLK